MRPKPRPMAGLFFDGDAAMARRRDFLIDKKFGSVIRMQRVKLGMSQTELGNALGVTFQQIQKYEHGTNARRVCRNVKRWRSASMAMRWTAAAMQEAAKGFRRLKAHKQLPALRAALEAHQTRHPARGVLARQANAA
jgi:DNA-binding XRE family transcriptional regulator